MNAGQTYVAPDIILAHKDIKRDLIKNIEIILKESYCQNPNLSKDYGRIINKRQFENLVKLIDSEKIVIGEERDINNLYISPTVLDNVSWEDKVMDDEIFDPILPIIEYENIYTIIFSLHMTLTN